jgi:hypothetical protein
MKALLAAWDQYVSRNGVLLTNDGPFLPKAAGAKGASATSQDQPNP